MAGGPRRQPPPRPPPLAGLVVVLLAGCLNPIESGTLTPGDGTVHGYVSRRCGDQPLLPGAQVSVDGVVRAHTDDAGSYRIEGVKAGGVHTMAADLAGYVHTEVLVSVAAGETSAQNFALEAPGDASTPVLLDVLFVIDNSATMQTRQAALVAAFPALAALLEASTGINLHLGIVTTDVGAGPTTLPGCVPGGDRGLLQMQPLGATCDRASLLPYTGDRYLGLVRDAAGTVSANFEGTLADAFACYAPVGTGGCSFPMPLEAMSRAIDPTFTENGDFLRDGATLLIVIVTDKDDCSAPAGTDLFDPFQTDPASVLGPLSTYRCFEFGVTCDDLAPGRRAGTRSACAPGEPDPRYPLTPVAEFEALLSTRRAVLGVLAGPPSPVNVVVDAEGYSRLVPYCFVDDIGADPAIRLAALAATMPTSSTPVCNKYGSALPLWGQQAVDLAVASRSCE
jgi:hypothetical protein